MKHTAKRSAASRKAWRTRKRMAYARNLVEEFVDFLQPETVTGRIGVLQEATMPRAQATPAWPTYMKRALPNPWNKALPPW